MSDTKKTINSEEIDLRQLLKLISDFFKKILIAFFDLIKFFKKKFFILIAVVIIGIAGGYVLEYFFPEKNYSQEIIIEPNQDSAAYIYDFVKQFNQGLEYDNFNKNEFFEKTKLKGLSNITIEPVIDFGDILKFHKDLDKQSSSYNIIKDLEPSLIGNEKYIYQFRFHKLRFYYKKEIINIAEFASFFLKNIEFNDYFRKRRKIISEKLDMNIKEHEKSILFINDYIAKISKNKSRDLSDDVVVFGNEKEIPTVTSLIREKNILLREIADDKEELQMHQMLFNIVKTGNVMEDKNLLNNRKKLLPLVLLGCFLGFYLLKFLYNKSQAFVAIP